VVFERVAHAAAARIGQYVSTTRTRRRSSAPASSPRHQRQPAVREARRWASLAVPSSCATSGVSSASTPEHGAQNGSARSRIQEVVAAEIRHLERLQAALRDHASRLEQLGAQLAESIPLTALGLQSSAPLVAHFEFIAAKVHPNVRLVTEGGSMAGGRYRTSQSPRCRRAVRRRGPRDDPGRSAAPRGAR
jgi:hypothetical protein